MLDDADGGTLATLVHVVLSGPEHLHEGHIRYLADKLSGEAEERDGRYATIDAERPAAYVCRALQTFADGRYAAPLPQRYAAMDPLAPLGYDVLGPFRASEAA